MAERGIKVLAIHEITHELRETRIMSDDQQGLYGRRCVFKKVAKDIDIGAVEQIFDLAGGLSRKFLQHAIERLACSPGRRNKG
jgi:hypothetical protein